MHLSPLPGGGTMGTEYEMVCAPADISTVNGTTTCANPQWMPQPSVIPSLSASDGGLIAVAILACWAVAFGYKALRRAM